MTRARANLAALHTLRALGAEERGATTREQQVLARWSGWGALPQIFEGRPARAGYDSEAAYERATSRWDSFTEVRDEVRTLLSEEEWTAARRNTLNAHFTDAALVQAIWGSLRHFGFTGGNVLEPGSGAGHFIGLAPTDTERPVRMTGVEVEPTTAALSRHLYPDAHVLTSGLEAVTLPDGAYDAVVGNVPFGRYARFDAVHNPDLQLSIHDHFVLKSLTATRPGGVVALITSRFTLDAQDALARERMHEIGDLVGAVRLPAQAHRAAAGTDVVTDVLFLRRRQPGEALGDGAWLQSTPRVLPGHEEPVGVNDYFDQHPEYVLGDLRTRLGPFGPELTVTGHTDALDGDIAQELAAAAEAIASTTADSGISFSSPPASAAAEAGEVAPVELAAAGAADGALGLAKDGSPTIVDGGRHVPVEVHPEQRDRLVQLIELKQRTQALYGAEADTDLLGETPRLAGLRKQLRERYREYRKAYPPLTKPRQPYKFTPREAKERAEQQGLASVPEEWKARTAYAFIDDDPEASLLFGLEEWDEKTGKGTEQQILTTRVLEPRQLPERVSEPEDAVAVAMEFDGGRLEMGRVAGLLGIDEETAAAQLAAAGLVFRDPGREGAWEPRHRYLSGNVRTRLIQACEAAAQEPGYAANVAALERVQPADLAPSEIRAKLGAPWIPSDVYTGFLHHLGFAQAEVRHAGGTMWEVRGARDGDLARSEWGTSHRPAQDLFLALLNQTDSLIQVTYTDSEGRTHVNQDATDEAREKARLIGESFGDWVWSDLGRADRLAGLYNEKFNNLVLPEYEGSRLTLPGLIAGWDMRPHQNAAIRRIVNEPTALLAHVVGAGKTATMVGGAMELRRTGLAKKPAIVVPNHMLKQFSREFTQLYPHANLLAISASDLSKKRRAKFMARIAGGDWDAVILTHEAFNRVPLRPETQQAYLEQEMSSLRTQIELAREAGMNERTVKQVETTLANNEARFQKQLAQTSEPGVCLEDTGIDYLFLDEAHEYKNLATVSAIPGAAIEGSAKATKLHMVLSWLRETNDSDRVATLATGTPIANSVTEAYVLMRYLAPQLLESMGLDAFDNWASTFGEVVSALEPDPKGNGYRYKARFSRFFNMPELMSGYRSFADVQMAQDLKLPTPPVRESDGQRGETVLIPATAAQRQYIKDLPNQPWANKPGGVLKALGEGLRASLDMRLVGHEEDEGSKLSHAAEKIAEIWQETKDTVYPLSARDSTPQELPGGLQLVFLDEGTPGSNSRHNMDLYADLRDQLADLGVPRQQVRFVHEANTDRKKETLFADCRAGRVSVLIGSTQKMGTGTNVQDRAVALHHLSYPWRPADMAQRDGRIERRGNLNHPSVPGTPDDVRILYYVTERTFDEFRLNTLARKARFIGQIQRREFNVREIEDIGAEALNLGTLSALASGDPAILQFAEATAERARLQGLARTWDRQQDARAEQLHTLDAFLEQAETTLTGMHVAMPQRRPTNGDAFAMTVDGRTYRKREDAAGALGDRMVALARDQSLRPGQRVPVGTLGGLDFHAEATFDGGGRRHLKLRFEWGHVVPLGHRDDRAQWQAASVTRDNGRGAIQSLERFLTRMEADLAKLETEVASQRGRRAETADNLRSKDDNPYRTQSRSKEREERLLGKLVIANEKESQLSERIEPVGEHTPEEEVTKLAELREDITGLRQAIEQEHTIQEQAQELTRRTDTAPRDEEPLTAEESPLPGETLLDAPAQPELDAQTPEEAQTSTQDPPQPEAVSDLPTPEVERPVEPEQPAPAAEGADVPVPSETPAAEREAEPRPDPVKLPQEGETSAGGESADATEPAQPDPPPEALSTAPASPALPEGFTVNDDRSGTPAEASAEQAPLSPAPVEASPAAEEASAGTGEEPRKRDVTASTSPRRTAQPPRTAAPPEREPAAPALPAPTPEPPMTEPGVETTPVPGPHDLSSTVTDDQLSLFPDEQEEEAATPPEPVAEPSASIPAPPEPEPATQNSEPAPATGPVPAPAEGGLPLWGGADLPEETSQTTHVTPEPAAANAQEPAANIFDAFEPVLDAWSEIVPPELGTAQDLRALLETRLTDLQQQWDRIVPVHAESPPVQAPSDPSDARRDADAINTALRQADTHVARLRPLPEWQGLQAVRQATGNLWNAMKEKAGGYFDQLLKDSRVQGFWRTVSIRSVEKVGDWAQATLDKLRLEDPNPDRPHSRAMQNLSDAAVHYSAPQRGRPEEAGNDREVNIPHLRRMGEALGKPPGVSAAAAKSRSTTARSGTKATLPGEQAAHLRPSPSADRQESKGRRR